MVGGSVVRKERGGRGEERGGEWRVEGHFKGETSGVICIAMLIRYKTMWWNEYAKERGWNELVKRIAERIIQPAPLKAVRIVSKGDGE